MDKVHATCVVIDGCGVLLRGGSGSGKSDLALRLIHEGAHLVSDDYTILATRDLRLFAEAPPEIAGLLEVRGLGILRVGGVALAEVRLVVDLAPADQVERMPETAYVDLHGVNVPCIKLNPLEASATAKVHLAVKVARGLVHQVK